MASRAFSVVQLRSSVANDLEFLSYGTYRTGIVCGQDPALSDLYRLCSSFAKVNIRRLHAVKYRGLFGV